uniref:Transposase n=1 Tax=Candidatus Kentrum sp. UNK TaxID=2126344 RepID=A0A451B680_9GAMM|nr:MAG: Transposase [Candidatus Kentron sp. UNK]
MRYIGIDVAKATLAVFLPPQGNCKITNDQKGFLTLVKALQPGDIVGVESTGKYHHPLARFLLEKGFEVRELNPILTKQFIRATIRKKKTDKSDAEIISRLIAQKEGHKMTLANLDNQLKDLFRLRTNLVQDRTTLKLRLQAANSRGKFIPNFLKNLIKQSERSIAKIEAAMNKVQTKETAILESLPGISAKSARGILAELGDVNRFSSKRKIVAFAGYDPKLIESGTSLHRS